MGEASCPKATIVVPVYNSARSIQRCLDSLLAQSERSIQVVCVNDGSTDDSLNVLRQIAQADDRVLVIDQENAGVSCARNAGIDVAEGETVFEVRVAEGDMGKVIGRQGRIAKEIRTIIKAVSQRDGKRVTVDIVD